MAIGQASAPMTSSSDPSSRSIHFARSSAASRKARRPSRSAAASGVTIKRRYFRPNVSSSRSTSSSRQARSSVWNASAGVSNRSCASSADVSAVVVSGGLLLAGVPLALALLFGGIATATAPAATYDVIKQSGRKGAFVETLEGIVAIDDVWGLIVFSILLSIALSLTGNGGEASVVAHAAREIFGALLVGGMVGVPGAYLTGRLEPGEPMKLEGLGLVFICAGLALWLDVSFMLAGMVAGAIIVNLASHHTRPFHEIEDFGWPFMMLFFLLAGASLEVGAFAGIGLVGAGYIALRGVSRWLGGWLGGRIAGADAIERNWIGFALMPQAGVAIGMALVAGLQLPEYRDAIIAVTVGSTVVFELFGPLLTRMAIEKAAG